MGFIVSDVQYLVVLEQRRFAKQDAGWLHPSSSPTLVLLPAASAQTQLTSPSRFSGPSLLKSVLASRSASSWCVEARLDCEMLAEHRLAEATSAIREDAVSLILSESLE